MKDPNNPCLFCSIEKSNLIHENNLAYASYDSYPVSKHHCLIIPKRHIKDYFDLTNDELIACNELIRKVKDEIILAGSGKGVASVKTIKQISWRRKSLNQFRKLSKYYHLSTIKCNTHKF